MFGVTGPNPLPYITMVSPGLAGRDGRPAMAPSGRINFIHLRQFRPDENARPVAQAVKIIAVLIVRAADDGAAHLLDELDVLVHVRLGNRPALVDRKSTRLN